MRIQHMFHDDINRQINGVIKVDQKENEVIEQEVREYVITKELRKHFSAFFNYYSDSFDGSYMRLFDKLTPNPYYRAFNEI